MSFYKLRKDFYITNTIRAAILFGTMLHPLNVKLLKTKIMDFTNVYSCSSGSYAPLLKKENTFIRNEI